MSTVVKSEAFSTGWWACENAPLPLLEWVGTASLWAGRFLHRASEAWLADKEGRPASASSVDETLFRSRRACSLSNPD